MLFKRPLFLQRGRSVVSFFTALAAASAGALADPPLPVIPSVDFNVAVANANINGGVPATASSTNNAAAINAYINYVSAQGGGIVEIPAGTYLSNTITLKSNVDLQLDSGAILRDTAITNTLITTSGHLSNVEISGSGIIDGAATKTVGSANLVILKNVTNLAVEGVSIENSAHEHLVPESDSNVTISGVTITDPGTLAANKNAYLANTDGIDYSGSNFLIENCNISDGDDDIVAKPASTACSNITITGCTIGAGHGISVGGGSAEGLSNLTVTNCTFNGTTNGLRLKAADVPASDEDSGGGTANPVQNVTFSNITMTNVTNPIIINSFYDNGNDNFPTSPTGSSYAAVTTPVDATTPIYGNISFQNITVTGASNAGEIYGLNTSPNSIEGLSFDNVNISAAFHMNLWYAGEVDLSGLTVNVPSFDAYATASPVPGVDLFAVSVPEPATGMICLIGAGVVLTRRRR